MIALTPTPNKAGTPGEDESYEELMLILSARRSDLEGPPWTSKALKERIAKREAREEAYHRISRWLKRLATEDPAVIFPG